MSVLPDADQSQAVFLGVESYHSLETLPATRRNVTDLVAVLQSRRHWGIPVENCHVLSESSSPRDVDTSLSRAASRIGKNGILLFYFAGHGLIDDETGELYLGLQGTDPEAPHATALPYSWVRRSLKRSIAMQRFVILDCCYAGRAEMGAPTVIARFAHGDGDQERTCLLAATSRNRVALAPAGAVHTAFSGELISTLDKGIDGGPPTLDLDLVWRRVSVSLRTKGFPAPEIRETNGASKTPLVRNIGRESASVNRFLNEIDRRFAWRSDRRSPQPPATLFWSVHLRHPTLIHAVQATVAAALSARGVTVILSIEDSHSRSPDESVRALNMSVSRWFEAVPGASPPSIVRLDRYITEVASLDDAASADEASPHPISPWQLEREYYADASINEILNAAKIFGATDGAATHTDAIERQALDAPAYRLLTPISLWSRLHLELRNATAATVMTLGGDDERMMWQQWHRSFGGQVSHLYNPHIERTSHDAGILLWNSHAEFRDILARFVAGPSWDSEGGYVHWVGRNAFLMPQFILGVEPMVIAGHRIQSWPDVKSVLVSAEGLDAVSAYISAFFLGS